LFRWGDYRNKGHNPENVLGSSPGEDGFCSSVTKHDRKMAPRTTLLVSAERVHEQKPQPRKIVLGSSPGENAFVARKLSTIEEWSLDQNYCFGEEITEMEVTNPNIVLGSSPGEDVGFMDNNVFL
jgi:hypothetical protein